MPRPATHAARCTLHAAHFVGLGNLGNLDSFGSFSRLASLIARSNGPCNPLEHPTIPDPRSPPPQGGLNATRPALFATPLAMNPFYKILNPLISRLLRSRWHGLASAHLMLLTFTGRKTGTRRTTPVRYVRKGELILCFTTPAIPWWRNLVGGAAVELLIAGQRMPCYATALVDDTARITENLHYYFSLFPGDALFYHLKLDKQKKLAPAALQKALRHMVVIEARPLS